MSGLLDSDVLIDVQRAHPAAERWLSAYVDPLALLAGVALELLMGSRDKAEMARNERFLRGFDVEALDSADTALALRLVVAYKTSTGLGLGEFLIAAQAINRRASLFTFNLKHFRAVSGLDAQAPYAR